MEPRKLSPEENHLTRPLYEEVFREDSASFVEYYYTEKTKDNLIYVGEDDGRIRAMLHLNPYTVMVNGREENLHYIVAVATEKAYRGRGYMSRILREALCGMYREGEPFTYLMPAAEAIYFPHGFRTVHEQRQKYWEEGALPDGWTARKARPQDAERMAAAEEENLSRKYQVYAKRTKEYYLRLMKEYESDGGCLMVCEDESGAVREVRVCAERPPHAPKIMVRVVNVRRLLLLLSLRCLTAVCFRVTDPLIPENNQVFLLTGTEFSGAMLMESRPENSEGTLTAEALARLVFGASSVDEIAAEKGVEMTDRMQEELKKIIPLSEIFLNEIV